MRRIYLFINFVSLHALVIVLDLMLTLLRFSYNQSLCVRDNVASFPCQN